jgi:hypothetical protein
MIEPARMNTDLTLKTTKVVKAEHHQAGASHSIEPQESFQSADVMAPASTGMAKVRVFPQDPLVGPTEEIELPKEILGTKLSSPRMKIQDRNPVAIADTEGNYNYEVGTPQFDQVNAYAIVANTLSIYDKFFGAPAKWSFPGPLSVIPHKGTGKTAYFSRSVTRFGTACARALAIPTRPVPSTRRSATARPCSTRWKPIRTY